MHDVARAYVWRRRWCWCLWSDLLHWPKPQVIKLHVYGHEEFPVVMYSLNNDCYSGCAWLPRVPWTRGFSTEIQPLCSLRNNKCMDNSTHSVYISVFLNSSPLPPPPPIFILPLLYIIHIFIPPSLTNNINITSLVLFFLSFFYFYVNFFKGMMKN